MSNNARRASGAKGEVNMPFYLTQAKLSKHAIQAMMAKPQDRTGPVGKLLEAVGGKLHHYFFAFGEYDVVLLYEAPDNASAAAPLLTAIGAGTAAASKTTVLMSTDEAMTAMRKAGAASKQYQPPGS
jgi:uncharacterized protein with GYD domain